MYIMDCFIQMVKRTNKLPRNATIFGNGQNLVTNAEDKVVTDVGVLKNVVN